MDLDHNLLMNLAIGNKCVIYDCGTNRKFSKTIYLGVPLIRYVLNRRWFGLDETAYRLSRDGKHKFDETKYFSDIYESLFVHNQNKHKGRLKVKLDYYKKFLLTDQVHLSGVSMSTSMDGQYQYFKNKVKENDRYKSISHEA